MIKPLIIVAGEPYSIFSEIFSKCKKKIKCKYPIILVISKNLLISQLKKLRLNLKFKVLNEENFKMGDLKKNEIYILDVNFYDGKPFKKISSKSRVYIKKCFEKGISLIKKHKIKYLINGPISKKHFLSKKYLGITEYISDKMNSKNKEVMLIYSKDISVSPITTHNPLRMIFKKITKSKIVLNVKTINEFYKKNLFKKPKFAITGLNPHCESNNKINEENSIIKPAVRILKKNSINIKGPFSADTIFLKNNIKKFDVIIGMYHDQVLSPIKTLLEFKAINITLGIPILRISPDHGPNFEMIGKNISNYESLLESLSLINKIYKK